MATYIDNREFITKYVLRNTRIRRGFVDMSRALEETTPRQMIAYMMATTWDCPKEHYPVPKPDKVAGMEGMGFGVASIVAERLDLDIVAVRERYQLAGKESDIVSVRYNNHNGRERTVELRRSSIKSNPSFPEPNIIIVDDLLRTGAKVRATTKAIRRAGGRVVGAFFIAAIEETGGLEVLEREDIPVDFIVSVNMGKLESGEYRELGESNHTDKDATPRPEF